MVLSVVFYLTVMALVLTAAYFVNGSVHNKGYRESNAQKTAEKPRQELLNIVLLWGIFLVLFAVSAFRIGIGNDYWAYRNNFLALAGGKTKVSYELGFKALVLIVQHLFGLDNYRVTFAVMAFFTCGFFVKGIYDTADWFVMSLFLFLSNGFYLMSFSNVRYYFAFAVCLYAMKFVFQRKYISFILWICFAALFHKTILIAIPAYLIAWFLRWNKKTIWLIPAGSLLLIMGKPMIRWVIFRFYPFYEGSAFDTGDVSYMNILKCAAVLVFGLLFYKESIRGNQKAEMLFNLNLFALLLYSFGSYVPELTRICYYLVLGQIFLLPIILQKIPQKLVKNFCLWGVVAAYCCYFLIFLWKGAGADVLILPYLTWIFV